MAFTAKDVQALRQATGAGMMDAKRALEANDGDAEAATQWLREQGLAASAKREDRENTQGVHHPRTRRLAQCLYVLGGERHRDLAVSSSW